MTNKIKFQYRCLGCGKEYNTYKEYPLGWICLECRPTTKITVKCSECGSDVPIYWNTYRMKDPNIQWRCRSCNDKYRNKLYNTKSEEEKKAFVDKQVARIKTFYANMTPDERAINTQHRKDGWNKMKKNGTAWKRLDPMKQGRIDWYNSLSDEEKKSQWELMNAGRDRWWNSLSDEEKAIHMSFAHIGFSEWYRNLSPEDQKAFMDPIHTGCKQFWENMTPESFSEWQVKCATAYNEYVRNINPLVRGDQVRLSINEVAFINQMNTLHIPYTIQYANETVHPDFSKLFPSNPVTGATLVSPIHFWDFLVITANKLILVDIDGRIHFDDTYERIHPFSGIRYKEVDVKRFNDSQRPYQTDGLDAYAVLCIDDKLTDETQVKNINTNEVMSFSTFCKMLVWENMTNDEQQEILNSI